MAIIFDPENPICLAKSDIFFLNVRMGGGGESTGLGSIPKKTIPV